MRKYFPENLGPLTKIPPTGPSPMLMRLEEWDRVTPRWEQLTAQVGGCCALCIVHAFIALHMCSCAGLCR